MVEYVCMCQAKFFGNDHDGALSQAIFGFHGKNKHGNHLQLLFLC